MNNFFRQLPVALLLAVAASAQANIDPQPLDRPSQRIDITLPRLAGDAALQALRDGDITFDMSNGRTMMVSGFGEYLHLRYGKRSVKTLRHDGQGGFVSRDGTVSVQFDVDAQGKTHLVRLTAPADWL